MKLINKDHLTEIRSILTAAFVMDIALVAAGTFFVPFVNALTGALYGTFLLAADLFFLSVSVQNIASGAAAGKKNGSSKMTFFYILRMIFLFVCLLAAVKVSFISIVCTVIPLFYPKLIYPFRSIIRKKEG